MQDKLIFRVASINDLKIIINLLHDDILGKDREDQSNIEKYKQSFLQIEKSATQKLMVVEYEGNIIACCELAILYSLTLKGTIRLQVEGVRVAPNYQGIGIGEWMFSQIILFAKNNYCKIIQLTTNKERIRSHKFYKKLGFVESHLGMKLYLDHQNL